MFTGLITDVGTVAARDGGKFRIRSRYDAASIAIGASIACAGCCLTATEIDAVGDNTEFGVDVSNETLSLTTLSSWTPGRRVNLERSLKLGDEMGGHLVTGHVDGLAEIVAREADGESVRFWLEAPNNLARYIATKGSVALDGTSLTVNAVEGRRFGINLIPHSLAVTTWGERATGDRVNLEVDLLARYVARIGDAEGGTSKSA